MKKKKRAIIVLVLLIVILSIVYALMRFDLLGKKEEVPVVVEEVIVEVVEEEKDNPNALLREKWEENKKINPDYVGQIIFDSGIVDLPFVQADDVYDSSGNLYNFYDTDGNKITDMESGCDGYSCTGNDVYLWTDWKTMEYDKYENGGSAFMDYRNRLYDENLIIYGHHFAHSFDPDRVKAFTCFEKFEDYDYYEDNKYLNLVLDGEIRRYIVASACKVNIYDEEAEYYRTNLNYDIEGNEDLDYKETFFKHIKDIEFYDTGVELTNDDYTLILQTCVSLEPEYREILICKQIEVIRG